MLKLTLPYPPTANTTWRLGNGRAYISPKTKDFRAKVKIAAYEALGADWVPISAPICLRVFAFRPDKRKRDLDNILKGLLDALKLADVIQDDVWVYRLEVERKEQVKGGKAEVEILPYG